MKQNLASWLRVFVILAPILLVGLAWVYVLTGYPHKWDQVHPGMPISQIRILCGQPDYSSRGLKPDIWVAPLPAGKWELCVDHGEIDEGADSRAVFVYVQYRNDLLNFRRRLRVEWPRVQNTPEFYQELGNLPTPPQPPRQP